MIDSIRFSRHRSRLLAALVLAGVLISLGFGSATTADRKVGEGLRHFSTGEFEAAGKAFTEADVAEPENRTISFDRACALAAVGDVEQARELFQQSALARDSDLAANSHYNLGSLSAAEGRAALGEDPVAAPPEQRQQALSLLLSAAQHYGDCLRLVADHSDARHNLELIRLFIKQIEAQWEEQDRETARQEKGLLEFLAMIRQRQTVLRSTVRALRAESDSPQRRQAMHETSLRQTELQEEMQPLQEKMAEQFQAPQQGQSSQDDPQQDPATIAQLKQAQDLLTQLAVEAGAMMLDAAATIEAAQFSDAQATQRDVLDRLNQIFMAVAPFSNVLQRATQQQDQLSETSRVLTRSEESVPQEDTTAPAEAPADAPTDADSETEESTNQATPDTDFAELQWQQTRVTDWSRMLSLKAKSKLPEVDAQLQTTQTEESAGNPNRANTSRANTDDPAHSEGDEVDPSAQLRALRESLQKAIELAPKVEQHSSAAATNLGESDLTLALPDQQQAQELLREIAEPLAQENQQQGDPSSGNENERQQDQESQQQQQQRDSQDQQQAGESPQEQALSTLRRARQREREHRDLQKQLQQMLGGRVRVDRDW